MYYLNALCLLLCLFTLHSALCGRAEAKGYDPSTLVIPPFEHSWGIHKGTEFHLFLLLGPRVRFRNPQGLAVVKLKSLDDPDTPADDDEVTVYGVNSGQNNIIYNTSMYSLGVYGLEEEGAQRLRSPRGIAADVEGNVYVADTGHRRVVHLFNSGSTLIYRGEIGSEGGNEVQFVEPHGLALDSRGNIYVTDAGNNCVWVFDQRGNFLRTFGQGVLDRPEGIAVIDEGEKWSYRRENGLYVVDSVNARIQKFDLQGNLLRQATAEKVGIKKPHFAYLAIDYYGNVYVTDRNNHAIHKLDRNLRYITAFGRRGTKRKQFISPRGIAIWRRFGQIFFAEEKGAQYYWVGIDILHLKAEFIEERSLIKLGYFLTERGFVTIDILDRRGEVVKQLLKHKLRKTGKRVENLDITDLDVDEKYTVRITAEPTYSSYHFFKKTVEINIERR